MKQKAITISLIKKNNNIEDNAAEQRMTSLEIAQLTGKQHKNLMRDIRNMEPAWEKTAGLKFELSEYQDATGRTLPCYSLTKTECLYIATKFNDEARARLVLRWQELEMDQREALEWERWKARWSQIERPTGRGRRHHRRGAGRAEPAKRRLLHTFRDWQAFRTGRARP